MENVSDTYQIASDILWQDAGEGIVRSRQLHIYRRSATKETLGLSKNGKAE